eukprot:gene20606-biopygen6829
MKPLIAFDFAPPQRNQSKVNNRTGKERLLVPQIKAVATSVLSPTVKHQGLEVKGTSLAYFNPLGYKSRVRPPEPLKEKSSSSTHTQGRTANDGFPLNYAQKNELRKTKMGGTKMDTKMDRAKCHMVHKMLDQNGNRDTVRSVYPEEVTLDRAIYFRLGSAGRNQVETLNNPRGDSLDPPGSTKDIRSCNGTGAERNKKIRELVRPDPQIWIILPHVGHGVKSNSATENTTLSP